MPMKNPLHPGRIVRHECLEPLNLTVKRAAEILGVARQALNNIVNEKAAIIADIAIRFGKGSWRNRERLAADAEQLRPRPCPPSRGSIEGAA